MGPIKSLGMKKPNERGVSAFLHAHALSTMASSNAPKSENKNKTPNGEITKTKKKKNRDTEKDQNKNKNKNKDNKKPKLSNCNSKQKEDKSLKKKVERNEEEVKTNVFPMNRIRTMIKGEDPDSRISLEALLAINNATEKFLEQFTQDAYACCVQDRKKSLIYQHLDFVPEKVKAKDALRERSAAGKGGC